MKLICHNGEFLPAGATIFNAANRGFRYGDGVFETGRVVNGKWQLAPLHLDRLFTSLQLLGIKPGPQFTPKILEENILKLCLKNDCVALARVRLAVYREESGEAGYVMEAVPLSADALQLNKKGWNLVVYPHARKSCDAFANLKSVNYLPYIMAGAYAAEKGADEALVLNSNNHIADGSKTNLFFIKEKTVYTPALNQGGVSGVLRQYVIDSLKQKNYLLHQTEVSGEDLTDADEIFCTNAVQGIRWVGHFNGKEYSNQLTQLIYRQLFPTF
ncbi:MAG: aminotransferase class IV [Chitinophagaceae bacterium]